MDNFTRELIKRIPIRNHLWKILVLSLFIASAPFTETWVEQLQYQQTWLTKSEFWRLLTAHWIHGSWAHWLFNLLALLAFFILLGSCITYREFIINVFFGALVVSLGLYFFTDYDYYLGFSAVLYGVFIYAAANAVKQGQRWFGLAIILYITGKILLDSINGSNQWTETVIGLPVMTESHLLGLLAGYIIYFTQYLWRRFISSQNH